MTNPRTPLREKLPLFFGAARPFQKGRGRSGENPWISASGATKCLIVEQNAPTSTRVISTDLSLLSTDLSLLSTHRFFGLRRLASLYLSLLKEERERREGAEKNKGVHGLAALPIFSSTETHPIHGFSRGISWMCLFNCFNDLRGRSVFVHASTVCFAWGYF
jgi:hypothetical protein